MLRRVNRLKPGTTDQRDIAKVHAPGSQTDAKARLSQASAQISPATQGAHPSIVVLVRNAG
jgi:hypothetical protein